MSQVQDRRRTRGLFKLTDFFIFRPILKIKLNKLHPKTWKSPGHATLHTCRVEECRGSLASHGNVAQETPAFIEPNYAHDQRDFNIVNQKTDPKVSCLHTLADTKEHLNI